MKNTLFTFMCFFTIAGITTAANPVTLTKFYQHYSQLQPVQEIESHGVLTGRVASFLMDDNNPIDEKAAVVNAFTANNEKNIAALTYKQFVARKYKGDFNNLDLNQLNGEELFILGYLTLMDDKGDPENALPILEMADQKLTNSLTVNTILALARAQQSISHRNECEAWQTINRVISGQGMNNDLDQQVVETIASETENLKSACD